MAHTQLIPATTILLLLFFLSPPLTTVSTTATTTTTTVLDIDGDPLEVGSKYRMGFAGAFYFFGGLTMISKRSQPECPQFVGASPLPSDNGPPVMFFTVNSTDKTISISSDLNIAFSGPSVCGQTMWRISAGNGGATGILDVTTDGVIGNPGDEIISKLFKIEKVEDEGISSVLPYKIRYCPEGNEIVCGDLGLWYDREGIWLGLNPNGGLEPFRVYFMKA